MATRWVLATHRGRPDGQQIEMSLINQGESLSREAPGMFIPKIQKPVTESDVPAPGTEQYKGTFDPKNLQRLGPGGKEQAPAGEAPAESPGAEQYKSIFDPKNLQQPGPEGDKTQDGATQ